MAPSSGKYYKVKLPSGRILGPLDLERIRKLIIKNQITGLEIAREHPVGEWRDINSHPEIAELLVARACGQLTRDSIVAENDSDPLSAGALPGATQVLPENMPAALVEVPEVPPEPSSPIVALPGAEEAAEPATIVVSVPVAGVKPEHDALPPPPTLEKPETAAEDNEKTTVVDPAELPASRPLLRRGSAQNEIQLQNSEDRVELDRPRKNFIAEARTVIFQRTAPSPTPRNLPGKPRGGIKEKIKTVLAFLALATIGYEMLTAESTKTATQGYVPVRPALPIFSDTPDPAGSAKLYQEAMKFYVLDHVEGYRNAAQKLRVAAGKDLGNVKALAMLASTYLNLIDSSNKDENFFTVLSKLIELSRAKNVDLPETIIADVEFYITANKAEAAQNRIVEYTKTHPNFGYEMFYYLALSFYHRGDAQNAARYLAELPENRVFSAKVFYLQGRIAEKMSDLPAALLAYDKALRMNVNHARSRVRVAEILYTQGRSPEAAKHLERLVREPRLLGPQDLSLTYFLHAQVAQRLGKIDLAIGDMERAVRLDPGNHDYLLELYSLRAKAGEKVAKLRQNARMYFFLGEGEKLLKAGRFAEAQVEFLNARHANEKSPIPLLKLGDMFARNHDLGNSRMNYKRAADLAPQNIEVWAKYIDVLIQSYEWGEAAKAMDRFRKLPVPQSAIDKAAADMYAKQGRHAEAQGFYKKAMSRDTIANDVYIAYARSLLATRQYKEAPFFFSLALRLDPLNSEAIIGTAKAIAESESIDRAIAMLQDELQKDSTPHAELLAAIAEFHMKKGEPELAQRFIDQAKAANPDYAYPWKLQAELYVLQEGTLRGALEKALLAYQSYSDRNASDPTGHLERYRIFVKRTEFEKAGEELEKIYGIYPKYPNLHYYKAVLYSRMGNHKAAVLEFRQELCNAVGAGDNDECRNPAGPVPEVTHPGSVLTLLGMGKVLMELNAPSEALKYYNRAMLIDPRSSEAKHEAGYANHLLKNYPGAIALYQASLAIDRANPMVYKRLGLAFRELGDNGSAAQAFRKYLEMEPDAPDRAIFEKYR
ncbi:MAG: tetratricopeptide repeat protein [Oligoflexia bacterium]|nr:tetratricopeptide repeat protein [Oligoflexia bacterium]